MCTYLIPELRRNHNHITLRNSFLACHTIGRIWCIFHIGNVQCDFIAATNKVLIRAIVLRFHMFAIGQGQVLFRQLVGQLFFPESFTCWTDFRDFVLRKGIKVTLDLQEEITSHSIFSMIEKQIISMQWKLNGKRNIFEGKNRKRSHIYFCWRHNPWRDPCIAQLLGIHLRCQHFRFESKTFAYRCHLFLINGMRFARTFACLTCFPARKIAKHLVKKKNDNLNAIIPLFRSNSITNLISHNVD